MYRFHLPRVSLAEQFYVVNCKARWRSDAWIVVKASLQDRMLYSTLSAMGGDTLSAGKSPQICVNTFSGPPRPRVSFVTCLPILNEMRVLNGLPALSPRFIPSQTEICTVTKPLLSSLPLSATDSTTPSGKGNRVPSSSLSEPLTLDVGN